MLYSLNNTVITVQTALCELRAQIWPTGFQLMTAGLPTEIYIDILILKQKHYSQNTDLIILNMRLVCKVKHNAKIKALVYI